MPTDDSAVAEATDCNRFVFISWVAVSDKRAGVSRMTSWTGATRQIVVTGLPAGFAANCASPFRLPDGAEAYEWPDHADDGVVFTVLAGDRLHRARPGKCYGDWHCWYATFPGKKTPCICGRAEL
jgi:hypothetical protein